MPTRSGGASGISDQQNGGGALWQYSLISGVRLRLGRFISLQDEDQSGTTLKAPDLSPLGWARWSYNTVYSAA